MEVGFNGGHSAAITLSITSPGGLADDFRSKIPNSKRVDIPTESVFVRLTAFDLCEHAYTKPNAEVLVTKFPGRFALVCGDSRISLVDFPRPREVYFETIQGAVNVSRWASGGGVFNLAFVDGLHVYEAALSDLRQSWRLSAQGNTVIVDDCDNYEVASAWATVVSSGAVIPRRPGIGWHGLCIGRWAFPFSADLF
jgi:hypothetical protein